MNKSKAFPGFSIVIAVGKWTRPKVSRGATSLRICIGFVAVSFWHLDMERLFTYLARKSKACEANHTSL